MEVIAKLNRGSAFWTTLYRYMRDVLCMDVTCIMELMDSRSVRISLKVLVPRMLRSVV